MKCTNLLNVPAVLKLCRHADPNGIKWSKMDHGWWCKELLGHYFYDKVCKQHSYMHGALHSHFP